MGELYLFYISINNVVSEITLVDEDNWLFQMHCLLMLRCVYVAYVCDVIVLLIGLQWKTRANGVV